VKHTSLFRLPRYQAQRAAKEILASDLRPFIVQNAILRVMWPFRKKSKQPKVVFNREHIGRELVPIPRRPLSDEEMEWARQSLSSRKEFADFRLPQLFAVSKCPCGTCRTVGLEPVELPKWRGESGHLGGITIETKDHGPIDILLHANKGFLAEMEVIWYNFPKPFPNSWLEVSRTVDPLH
jgi:hypothetical protein